MLTDPREIEIIAAAKQKNVRDPSRSREHFRNILADFFAGVRLDGSYVDLGPGQFDFGEIAREQGGRCLGVDFDPAVVELGRYKGFRAVLRNIQRLPDEPLGETFDGVFNKFTLNAFWTWDDDAAHRRLIGCLAGLIAPGGWAWIGPWNGIPKKVSLDDETVARTLALQQRLLEAEGFTTCPITPAQSKRYGIHGDIANNVVFIRNLAWTPRA